MKTVKTFIGHRVMISILPRFLQSMAASCLLMPTLPMTEFVAQNGTNLIFAVLLDERVEEDNSFGEKSEKVGIRMRAALAAVHNKDL